MQGKSTLHFMDQTTLKIGSTHPIWTSLSSTVSSVKKGTIKARLLTGTWKPISTNSVVEKSHLCANAVERRMKMTLISCYYVLRYTSKEMSHFLK